MAGPVDSLKFDPSRTPFTTPAPRFTYIDHPQAGKIKLNPDTMKVAPLPDKVYPNMPLRLPRSITDIDQTAIRTCSIPGPGNKGCDSAINGGCPLIARYGRGAGPFNLICEKNGQVEEFPCFAVYCGISENGRPSSQAHFLMDGWQILVDRTTAPQRMVKTVDGCKEWYTVNEEVKDLAPFYEEAKVGRFADPKPEKKKRGRPRKVDSGNQPTA